MTVDSTYLRRAIPADVDAISRLERQCFTEPWLPVAFQQFIQARGFLVAIEGESATTPSSGPLDGRLLGYVVTTPSAGQPRRVAHVRNLAVDPSARRRGIASELLQSSLGHYRTVGFERVLLEVRASNHGAIELYRRHGFQSTDRLPDYYGDGEEAIRMATELTPWSE